MVAFTLCPLFHQWYLGSESNGMTKSPPGVRYGHLNGRPGPTAACPTSGASPFLFAPPSRLFAPPVCLFAGLACLSTGMNGKQHEIDRNAEHPRDSGGQRVVPADWQDKCYRKADVDSWAEMDETTIAKCITYLKGLKAS